jgi:hypothetical protein
MNEAPVVAGAFCSLHSIIANGRNYYATRIVLIGAGFSDLGLDKVFSTAP